MKITFTIAEVTITLKSDIPIIISSRFQPFYTNEDIGYVAEFFEVKELPQLSEKIVYCDSGTAIIEESKNVFCRKFYDKSRGNIAYAVGIYDLHNRKIQVQYIEEGIPCINHTDGAFYHIGWEDILLHEKHMILHACCIETEGQGILFSGSSGIGKSTQGQLWCEYEEARMINGDRPILYKKNEIWTAFGSPYAGSSKCHENENTPVKAIVMLKQAKECSIRKLSVAEAFRRVYAQMTISTWDVNCVQFACTLAEQLVTEIPVYELFCTPDYRAVELLKEVLNQEGRE